MHSAFCSVQTIHKPDHHPNWVKFFNQRNVGCRSVIEELHKKSLESEEFGRKAARAFGSVSQLEVAGVKLRDVVLRNIQTDFKSK